MFKDGQVRVGITPTCWTNDDMPLLGDRIPFEQCVSEMALAGYVGCSVGHNFPSDPEVLGVALTLRGLSVSEPWVGSHFTARRMRERTLQAFKERKSFIAGMGGRMIVVAELGGAVHQQPVAALPNRPIFDTAEWGALVAGLNEIGQLAAHDGMVVAYHPHIGTGMQSAEDIERLMADTDPSAVSLVLDTGHLFYAGVDPLAVARRHAGRIRHVHLKDVREAVLVDSVARDLGFLESILEGVFTVPGDGVIDFAPILRTLADVDYHGWLIVEAEQDPAKAHPLTYAMKARAHLRDIAGI